MTDFADMENDDLAARIKDCVQKGEHATDEAEEHFKTAGRYLQALKERKPRGVPWSDFVKDTCGLKQSRADELIRIADGRTTQHKVRAGNKSRMRKARQRSASRDADKVSEPIDEQDDTPESDDEPSARSVRRPKTASDDTEGSIYDRLKAIEDETERVRDWLKLHGNDVTERDRRSIASRMSSCADDLSSMAETMEKSRAQPPSRDERPQRRERRSTI
jgi:hypothetical protein